MLKLKQTFYLHNNEITDQMRKSIINKYIEQLGKCVLADITENSGQADAGNIKGGKDNEEVC